jgi:hypothetical protein
MLLAVGRICPLTAATDSRNCESGQFAFYDITAACSPTRLVTTLVRFLRPPAALLR